MPSRPRLKVGLDSALVDGLRALYLPVNGHVVDVVTEAVASGIRDTAPQPSSAPTEFANADMMRQPGSLGSWNYNNTYFDESWRFGGDTITLLWHANWATTNVETFGRLLDRSTGGRGQSGISLYADGGLGRYLFAFNADIGSTIQSNNVTRGVFNSWAMRRNGNVGDFRLEGVDDTFISSSIAANFSTVAGQMGVFGTAGGWGTSRPFEGDWTYIAMSNALLSNEVINEWRDYPFQVLEDTPAVFDFGAAFETAAAAGPVDVIVPSASISLVAALPVITAGSGDLEFTPVQDTEGYNINHAASSIVNGDTLTPTVTLVPFRQDSEGGSNNRWNFFFGEVVGTSGKTVTFSISSSFYWGVGGLDGLNPWFSEDGGPWTRFANVSGSTTLTFSHSAPHTGNSVRFAMTQPFLWSDTNSLLMGSWGNSQYVQQTDSAVQFSGAGTYDIATLPSATDTNGRTRPALNQRAFWVTDSAQTPANGKDKLTAVLIAGVHAGEHVGTQHWVQMIEFLLAANPSGTLNQQVAAMLLQDWQFWCCDTLNPARYFSGVYGDAADGNTPAHDPGSRWHLNNPQNLAYLANVEGAWAIDGITQINSLFDCHSLPSDEAALTKYTIYAETDDSFVINTYGPQANTYTPGTLIPFDNEGAAREHARRDYPVPSNVNQCCLTSEMAVKTDVDDDDARLQAVRLLRALHDFDFFDNSVEVLIPSAQLLLTGHPPRVAGDPIGGASGGGGMMRSIGKMM